MNEKLGKQVVAMWKSYLSAMPHRESQQFAKSGYVYSTLPADLAEACRVAVLRAPQIRCDLKCHRVAFSNLEPHEKTDIDAGHIYKALDARTRLALGRVLASLDLRVAAILGGPWAILNVRSWISTPDARGGPYNLHTDDEPRRMRKIMIYWSKTSEGGGGLEIDVGADLVTRLDGPAGLWVLFANSNLMHRAVAPSAGVRVATEITIRPALVSDLRPRFLGANARHPIFPVGADEL